MSSYKTLPFLPYLKDYYEKDMAGQGASQPIIKNISNLNSVTETRIMEILKKACRGRTILSISHRLTAMLDCDQVIVLEKGRIQQIGTPDSVFISQAKGA